MKNSPHKSTNAKYEEILKAARKLFAEKGFDKTSVREIVREANTSMGNLYFYFPNKLEILKIICQEFVGKLRKQISDVHEKSDDPAIGFALDFKIGYIATMEDEKFSKFWLFARNIPEIHNYSLENKRIRLKTFFGDRIHSEHELNSFAIAIQGIADAFFEQKREGHLADSSAILSNTIIDFSLRLMGYSQEKIKKVIQEVEQYIRNEKITVDNHFTI
ncbi:TetR family transcriptional regulator [candidate division KSB1 bacterium]|nr:TetR family transcriptional regulator [candidate division KSB1 bacterium]